MDRLQHKSHENSCDAPRVQHKGGIQSLRVRSRDTVVWDLTHFSHESNELWEEAQVLVTGQQVTLVIRAGNEPSRGLKFHNHGEEAPSRAFSWLKGP